MFRGQRGACDHGSRPDRRRCLRAQPARGWGSTCSSPMWTAPGPFIRLSSAGRPSSPPAISPSCAAPTAAPVLQLHADHTYHANPLAGLLPEAGPRGADQIGRAAAVRRRPRQRGCARAASRIAEEIQQPLTICRAAQVMILQPPTNKPHGLREAYILDPDGYCWVPSRPLTDAEVEAVDAGRCRRRRQHQHTPKSGRLTVIDLYFAPTPTAGSRRSCSRSSGSTTA